MKSVALHNLGCKVNAYELDVMQQLLQEKGYQVVPFDSIADIYIVNTCTVTNIADRKSRQMLHRAKKINPDSIVVAVGCYVQTGQETVEKDDCIDLAVGNNRKKDLVSILEKFIEERRKGNQDKTLGNQTVPDLHKPVPYEEMTLKKTGGHTRAYIKIQDGCDQFCSYCIIPMARGRVRSKEARDIVEEARGLAEAGYKEIVLTGIHVSSYGMDFVLTEHRKRMPDGKELLGLLGELNKIEGLERIRLGSLEPRIVTEQFAEGLKELEKVCPHFHLSLQSGCDRTLKRMNRHYSVSEYYEKVRILRALYDNPAITTDVIVGFPGETETEFEETRAFLEKVEFYEMHIFKYSKRQGTNAAMMPDQIAENVKAKRSDLLLALEKQQSCSYRQSFLGKEMEVLLEEEVVIDGKIYMTGHTKEYIRAALPGNAGVPNELIYGHFNGFLRENIVLLQ